MRVSFSRAAQNDIQSIFDYILPENPAAARRVVAAIESATIRLQDFPLSGRIGAVGGTRELVITQLPYIVVYQVHQDFVEIVAVFHAAQNKPRGF
jgi:toxin ParE1/3/4